MTETSAITTPTPDAKNGALATERAFSWRSCLLRGNRFWWLR